MSLMPKTRFAMRPISPPLNVAQPESAQPATPVVSEPTSTIPGIMINNVMVVPIPGDPGYFADFEGNVYSNRQGSLKMLSVSMVRGYPSTSVMRPGKKSGTRAYIHTLVCTAHHGERPSPDYEVRHLDGDLMNNHPTNLAWGSKNDNAADKIIHGTEVNGEQNGLAKLTEAQVIEMRSTVKLASMSTSQFYKHLAVKYSITISAVGQILNGRSWRHLLSEDELAKLDEVYNAKPKRASFTQDREGTKISNARRDEMIARRIAGESVVKLAEEYGLSRKHAGTIFRQAGLTKS